MDLNHILIKGCPLCNIFLDPKENLKTKLYYKDNEDISESDFIIIDCKDCKVPMIVVRDHVESISKELWGRILSQVRSEFGNSSKLRLNRRTIKEHWHAHLVE